MPYREPSPPLPSMEMPEQSYLSNSMIPDSTAKPMLPTSVDVPMEDWARFFQPSESSLQSLTKPHSYEARAASQGISQSHFGDWLVNHNIPSGPSPDFAGLDFKAQQPDDSGPLETSEPSPLVAQLTSEDPLGYKSVPGTAPSTSGFLCPHRECDCAQPSNGFPHRGSLRAHLERVHGEREPVNTNAGSSQWRYIAPKPQVEIDTSLFQNRLDAANRQHLSAAGDRSLSPSRSPFRTGSRLEPAESAAE